MLGEECFWHFVMGKMFHHVYERTVVFLYFDFAVDAHFVIHLLVTVCE